jgi:putative membrane protein
MHLMKKFGILRQYQWRILLLRIIVNALALTLTVLLVPDIYFVDLSIGSLVIVTLVLSVLNALVRPILQFLTFRMLFGSFGLIIVVINAFILYLLARIVPNQFAVNNLFWAFVGGLLIGVFSNFLENLFGITLPILPDEEKELRRRVAEQDVSMIEAWIKERKAARATMQLEAQTGNEEEAGGNEHTGTPPEAGINPVLEEEKADDIPPGNPAEAAGGEA